MRYLWLLVCETTTEDFFSSEVSLYGLFSAVCEDFVLDGIELFEIDSDFDASSDVDEFLYIL